MIEFKKETGFFISKWSKPEIMNEYQKEGCSFCYVRFSYIHNSKIIMDEKFESYIDIAKSLGFKVSPYIYIADLDDDKPEMVRRCLDKLKEIDFDKDIPLAIGFENERRKNLDHRDFDIIRKILQQVINDGYDVVLSVPWFLFGAVYPIDEIEKYKIISITDMDKLNYIYISSNLYGVAIMDEKLEGLIHLY